MDTIHDIGGAMKRVWELEREVEALRAACFSKDEAIRGLLESCEIAAGAMESGYVGRGVLDGAFSLSILPAKETLAATPASVREQAEYARIGRKIREWAISVKPPTGFSEPAAAGYAVAICNALNIIEEIERKGQGAQIS